MTKRAGLLVTGLSLVLGALGCTHALRFEPAPERVQPTLHAPLRVGVLRYDGRDRVRSLHHHTVEALRKHPAVGSLKTRWRPARGSAKGSGAEVVLAIRPDVAFRGSRWNYPITFPGFLIFTPAWNGYVYGATVSAEIRVLDPATQQELGSERRDWQYSLRHCDRDRGFWANIGWVNPLAPLLSGFAFVGFDKNAGEEFVGQVGALYGDAVAEAAIQAAVAALEAPKSGAAQ